MFFGGIIVVDLFRARQANTEPGKSSGHKNIAVDGGDELRAGFRRGNHDDIALLHLAVALWPRALDRSCWIGLGRPGGSSLGSRGIRKEQKHGFMKARYEIGGDIVTEYRGFRLDQFQTEAIAHLREGRSVLVSAPTGVGKTLIADYLIESVHAAGGKVVYTAPIKALSNQKHKEFKRLIGPDNVGIITGDVVINSTAPVLIMTTEIFRNMLHLAPQELDGVSYVVFDEIHFLADESRGAVWEESIIFMPEDMRLLGLSATIPNAGELASWIEDIKGHEVAVVRHFERVVPLRHYVYERSMGAGTLGELLEHRQRMQKKLEEKFEREYGGWGWSPQNFRFRETTHMDLVKHLTRYDLLPALYFVFSRRQCEEKAMELARKYDFLTPVDKLRVERLFDERLSGLGVDSMASVKNMRALTTRGIAYHHAGLLPVLKEIVEDLFETRLIHVLYATETFAVGINFPVRTVCFDSVTKFDGVAFRPMSNQEYFQMAGRAGRRGIDKEGHVFIMVDLNHLKQDEFPSTDESELEPLRSQFSLSYNTILNLTKNYSREEIRTILKQNFSTYQSKRRREVLNARAKKLRAKQEEILSQFCEARDTPACPIYASELVEKLKILKRRYRNARGRKRVQERREALAREMEEIRALLEERTAKKCPKGKRRECRALLSEYQKSVDELASVYAELRGLGSEEKFYQEFNRKEELLERMQYIIDGKLLPRGETASRLHTQELLVTELIFSGLFHELDHDQLNALAVCIDYEARRGEFPRLDVPFDLERVMEIILEIETLEESYLGETTVQFFTGLAPLAHKWSQGAEFSELIEGSGYSDGDVVTAFRRAIDLMRQMKSACHEDAGLVEKLNECMRRMDRGVVEVNL